MQWYDCSNCRHRLIDIPTGKDPIYFAVPACAITPDGSYDPLRGQPTPKESKQKVIPPLSAQDPRSPKDSKTTYSKEEESILRAAQAILKQKETESTATSSSDVPPVMPAFPKRYPPTPASTPQVPTAVKSGFPVPPFQMKREGPRVEDEMEQDFGFVDARDLQTDVEQEIAALEAALATARLKARR